MRLRKLPFQGLLIAICIFLGCTTNKMVRNENESLEDLLLLWSKIDSLESNQLDRSSLALVEQAAVMAKQLHQSQYHLKALLTRIQLEQHLGDIGNLSMISQLEDAISLAETGVDRALLQSMLGQYYAVRASEMNGSAANLEGNESEIEFMSQRLLSNRADSLYDLSISTIHPEDLDEYELLVVPKEYDVVTFSTVSDLLFWRAINHFEKDVEGWLDASIYRSLAGDKVLSLYDRWLNDSQNSDSNRRVRIELKRLDLLNQHFRGPIDKRHDAYLHALDLLQSKYGPTPSCLHEIAMKRAAFLFSLPRTDYEEARSQAHQLAHNVLLRNPSAEIAASANGLIQSIEHPYLSLEVESVLLPQEHFLIRINHTNVDELELKIVPVDFDPLKRRNSNRNQEKEWDSYSRSASIHKEVHTLPKHKDFHSHSTDWIGPKLAAGHYILLVESKSSGRLRLMQELTVSGLSYRIHRGAEQNNVYVSDRANGEPKAGVHCTVYRWEWQQEGRGLVKIKDTNTGGDGALSIAAPLANQILLHMVDGEDQLWSEQVYFWHNRDDGMPSPSTQFYTDRAIYRPGDKIRFTCLLVQPKQNAPSALVVGQDLEITYHDANGEKIASLKGVTDEFGRITGEFEVPSDRLLGLMTLRTSFGQQSIRVEAYKKPTFSISLALEDSLPQLGKAVTVGGVVNSFVGFPIGGASVRYTIYRRPLWRFWGFHRRSFPQSEAETIVAAGMTATDANGHFQCSFTPKKDHKTRSMYHYEVRTEVTDLQGETQEGKQSFAIGTEPFRIQVDLNDIMQRSSLEEGILVEAINALGQEISLDEIVVRLYSGTSNRWYKNTYWSLPETSSYLQSQYSDKLPEYRYPGETTTSSEMLVDELILDQGRLVLPHAEAGMYRLEIQASAGGLKASFEREFSVIDVGQAPIPAQDLFITYAESQTLKVGEIATVHVATPQPRQIFYQWEDKSGILNEGILAIEGWHDLRMPIGMSSQGGLILHIQTLHSNRWHYKQIRFDVSWLGVDLNVVDMVIPQSTSPGLDERISFAVEDQSGQNVEVAYTLSIYDAALDEIAPHQWKGTFAPTFSPRFSVDAPSFSGTSTWPFNATTPARWNNFWVDPDLNWFQIRLHTYNFRQMHRRSMSAVADMAMSAKQEALTVENTESEVNNSNEDLRQNFSDNLIWIGSGQSSKDGHIAIDVPINDELTKWKGLLFIHSRGLESTIQQFEFVSRKDLLIVPNLPRFVRVQDSISLSAKIVNQSKVSERIVARLTVDATVYEDITVSLDAGQASEVAWRIAFDSLPDHEVPLTLRADGLHASDAIRKSLPVLSQSVLIRKGHPMILPPGQIESWNLSDIFASSQDRTDQHLTVEVCTNPLWYALASLPNLTGEHPTSLGYVDELYSLAVAAIMEKSWPGALQRIALVEGLNPLERNEEISLRPLKATAWLSDALEMDKRAQSWRHLIDPKVRGERAEELYAKLKASQLANGGWPWIEGGQPNAYITLQVLLRLHQIDGLQEVAPDSSAMIQNAIRFLDRFVLRRFQQEKAKRIDLFMAEYLHIRAQHLDIEPKKEVGRIYEEHLELAQEKWRDHSIYIQALIAKVFLINGNTEQVQIWTNSLKERAIRTENRGIYWKNYPGNDWREQSLQRHAFLTELFREIPDSDSSFVAALEEWLVAHKQVNHWEGNTNTVAAIQTLLASSPGYGHEVLITFNGVKHRVNDKSPFVRLSLNPSEINGPIELTMSNSNERPVYGFAHLNFRAPAKSMKQEVGNLKLTRSMYYVRTEQASEKYIEIGTSPLSVGDRILTRLLLEVDRPMEFIHLEDKRSALLEPVVSKSGFTYDSRVPHYRSSDDFSTHFFLEKLSKGRHILEYESWVTHRGVVGGGLAQLQHAFAPGYSGHSAGSVIIVD